MLVENLLKELGWRDMRSDEVEALVTRRLVRLRNLSLNTEVPWEEERVNIGRFNYGVNQFQIELVKCDFGFRTKEMLKNTGRYICWSDFKTLGKEQEANDILGRNGTGVARYETASELLVS